MNVLAIDTASYVMGVGLLKDGKPLGELVTHEKKNHSLRLMPAIRSLFDQVDLAPKDLDRIVVNHGPGSYTGVRIGVTTAKTMAYSLEIPVVGVSGLETLALNGAHFNGEVIPFLDARRGQAFTGLYRDRQMILDDRIIMLDEWLQLLATRDTERFLFISPDLLLHQEMILNALGERAVLAQSPFELMRPQALALAGMKQKASASVHTFKPNYLRLAEAESKWREQNPGKVENYEPKRN